MNREVCREIKLIETNRQLRNQIIVLNKEIKRLQEENKKLHKTLFFFKDTGGKYE